MTGVYQSDVRADNRLDRRGLPAGNQFHGACLRREHDHSDRAGLTVNDRPAYQAPRWRSSGVGRLREGRLRWYCAAAQPQSPHGVGEARARIAFWKDSGRSDISVAREDSASKFKNRPNPTLHPVKVTLCERPNIVFDR